MNVRRPLVVASIVLSGLLAMITSESALAQCIAHALPKLSLEQYIQTAAQSVRNETLANLIAGSGPPRRWNFHGQPYWSDIHNRIQEQVRTFYTESYLPRHLVCIAFTGEEYAIADATRTSGGRKIVLSMSAQSNEERSDGIFGADLELLRSLHGGALDYVDRMIAIRGRCPPWKATAVPTSTIQEGKPIVPLAKDTLLPLAVGDLFCRQRQDDGPRYADLMASDTQVFLQNHLAFFCDFARVGDARVLDATQILKTADTFPLNLVLLAFEDLENRIVTELTKLSALTVDQNALLNDVKRLIGKDYYERKIQRLQGAIAEATKRAQGPTLGTLLKSVPSAAGAIAELSNIASGSVALASLLEEMPSDGTVLYVISHQEQFNATGAQLSKGGAAVGKLIDIADSLTPDSGAAAELASLRAQLVATQKELDEFLKEIAAATDLQRQQYVDVTQHLIALEQERQRVFLAKQASLNKAVVKEMLGAQLAHASAEATQVCLRSVAAFTADPTQAMLSLLNENCTKYSPWVTRLLKCVNDSRVAPGSSLIFNGTVGLLIASERDRTRCF